MSIRWGERVVVVLDVCGCQEPNTLTHAAATWTWVPGQPGRDPSPMDSTAQVCSVISEGHSLSHIVMSSGSTVLGFAWHKPCICHDRAVGPLLCVSAFTSGSYISHGFHSFLRPPTQRTHRRMLQVLLRETWIQIRDHVVSDSLGSWLGVIP